jgi:hypothetical protein
LALVVGMGVLVVTSAMYAVPQKPVSANHTDHGSHNQNQIQAPPRPPRVKPLERVVVTSK